MYMYNEDYDTRALNTESKTYTVELGGEERAYNLGVDTEAKTYTVAMDRKDFQREHVEQRYSREIKDNTYYIKADGKN